MKAKVETNKVSENAANNLPAVDVIDNTTTKTVKGFGAKETANDVEVTLKKHEVFANLKEFFTPNNIGAFDSLEIEKSMQPLVDVGVISEAVMFAAIEKSRKEFESKNKESIAACENIHFDVFLERLKANEKLYKEVLEVCKLSEISESIVFDAEGNIVIYRGAQNSDKYIQGNVTATAANGSIFSDPVYKELRVEHTVSNYIAAIRYYSTYLEALKKVSNKAKDSEKVLSNAIAAVKLALQNGFSLEAITSSL